MISRHLTHPTHLLAALVVLGLTACEDGTGDAVTGPPTTFDDTRAAIGGGAADAFYVMSNQPGGNDVLLFRRGADGDLASAGAVATGGTGTGTGLGNQGALALSQDGRWLLVVNPGSDDVSLFSVRRDGLELRDRVPSGGAQPISVAVSGDLVYVLNAGGDGGISGFRLDGAGSLNAIGTSTRPLSGAGVGPAQIGFDRSGRMLVVTEKASNTITTYVLDSDDRPGAPIANPSAGQTPFGFSFDNRGRLAVSEAFGGGTDASAASVYSLRPDGTLDVLSPSLGTTETAACWIVVSRDGRFIYTTNTGSGTLTGFRVDARGGLSLLDPDGRTGVAGPGTRPIDGAIGGGGRFVYALLSGTSEVAAFEVRSNGALHLIGRTDPLPEGANGLAAR